MDIKLLPPLDGVAIGATPVTNAQFAPFARARGLDWKMPDGKDDLPATYVSWHDAVTFCEWLSETTGKQYRLPTDAEWQAAAEKHDWQIDTTPGATVWELCSDGNDLYRARRGGSWIVSALNARCPERISLDPDGRCRYVVGFRLCCASPIEKLDAKHHPVEVAAPPCQMSPDECAAKDAEIVRLRGIIAAKAGWAKRRGA